MNIGAVVIIGAGVLLVIMGLRGTQQSALPALFAPKTQTAPASTTAYPSSIPAPSGGCPSGYFGPIGGQCHVLVVQPK